MCFNTYHKVSQSQVTKFHKGERGLILPQSRAKYGDSLVSFVF